MKTTATTAREYLRVSEDRSGKRVSTDEQHGENEAAAGDNGWTLGEPYRDDDRSASRYATKEREDFGRLMDDLQQDRFGADVLILWESSRGSRKEGEWVALIDLLEERGVRVYVTTHERLYNPANGRDRKALLEDALDSAYESWKISKRVKRNTAASAAKGRPHGRTPFGYRRTYDPNTGLLVRQEPHPDEAPLVVELFDRIAKGHSLRSITLDFEARGVLTRSGKVFSQQHLRSLVTQRLYVGEREYTPGRKGRAKPASSQVIKADWPGLVPKATFVKVQRILSDPSRKTVRPGRAVHLLSMIARCAVCNGPMTVTYRQRPNPSYECRSKGHVRVSKVELDGLARDAFVEYFSRREVYEAVKANPNDDAALAAVRDEIAALNEELDDLAAQVGSGALSATLAARAEPGILARLDAARDRERQLQTPSELRGLFDPDRDLEPQWDDEMPMSSKREVMRVLWSPAYLGPLRVVRSPGYHVPIKDRVESH